MFTLVIKSYLKVKIKRLHRYKKIANLTQVLVNIMQGKKDIKKTSILIPYSIALDLCIFVI